MGSRPARNPTSSFTRRTTAWFRGHVHTCRVRAPRLSAASPQHLAQPTMEDILTAQFDRVEKALSTLVDSIAAYNPSPQAAIDLVAADEELSQGLDQCT
jgi:hypothetical protein